MTPALPKLSEDFAPGIYVGPAILEKIDPNQFGVIPKGTGSVIQSAATAVEQWSANNNSSDEPK